MKSQPAKLDKIMPWIDVLPGVARTDLRERRDTIQELTRQAAEATYQALKLTRHAERLRERANHAAMALEGDAKDQYLAEGVEKAKMMIYAR